YYDNVSADLIVAQSDTSLSDSTIPATLHDKLVSVSGATDAGHAIVAGTIFTSKGTKTPVTLVGYNATSGIGGPWNLAAGRGVQSNSEILLDTHLAHESGFAIGDKVDVQGRTFTVVGLTRETNSFLGYYVFISRNAAEALLGFAETTSFYALRLPAGTDVTAVAKAVESQVSGVKAATPARLAANARKSLGSVLDSTLNAVLVVGILIGVAVMGLTAYTAVVDRMREYGVLKAMGADGWWLARLVVRETVYRAVLGFVLGVALSYALTDVIARLAPRLNVLIRPDTLISAGLAAVVMTVIAALLPIRRIAAIDPAVVFKS